MPEPDSANTPPRGAKLDWLYRFRGVAVPEPAAPIGSLLAGGFGVGLAIAVLGLIGDLADASLLIAPLGATSLLLFALPESVMSQPRNVILGHLIAVALAIGFGHLLGSGWGAAALATALAVVLMQIVRAVHAPAGATAVLAAFQPHEWSFIGLPVMAGAASVIAVALVFNNLVPGRRYPLRWF